MGSDKQELNNNDIAAVAPIDAQRAFSFFIIIIGFV